MRIPEVHYTRRDDVDIAYQTFGAGDAEVVLLSEWVSNAATVWEHPGHIRNWRWQGRMGRVVRFDRSGIGASTRLSPERTASLDEWVADISAVIDAVGFERPIVMGEGFAAHAAVTFVAAHPDRVAKLALVNAYATLDPKAADSTASAVARLWGSGRITAAAPGLAGWGDYCARYEQAACDATTAAAVVRAMYTSDIRPLLPQLRLPVLVSNTNDLVYAPAALTRELADAIPEAEYHEWTAATFYALGTASDAFVRFVRGDDLVARREVIAMLFTDIVDSTRLAHELGPRWRDVLEDIDVFTSVEVEHHGGRIVTRTGDGSLACFGDTDSAVRAALAIVPSGSVLGAPIRAGVHVGEVDVRDDGDLAGVNVHIAARVCAHSEGGKVFVSEEARSALGADVVAQDAGTHELKGIAEPVRLYEVSRA